MTPSFVTRARLMALGIAIAFVAAACGSDDVPAASPPVKSTSTTSAVVATTAAGVSVEAFAAAADKVCIAQWPKVAALKDPDGNGGEKALGLGPVVRDWADELAAITPPPALAQDWAKATGLIRRSGVRLADAERLAAAGDPRSGPAQSEALWSLQPAAQAIINEMHIPFKACFVE